VAVVEAIGVSVLVACATSSGSLDDVILAVMLRESCPKLLNRDIRVTNVEARGSVKSSG
jgi:hypothetical protein